MAEKTKHSDYKKNSLSLWGAGILYVRFNELIHGMRRITGEYASRLSDLLIQRMDLQRDMDKSLGIQP